MTTRLLARWSLWGKRWDWQTGRVICHKQAAHSTPPEGAVALLAAQLMRELFPAPRIIQQRGPALFVHKLTRRTGNALENT